MSNSNNYEIGQYAVLGLGVFGSTVAVELSNMGVEVIGVDKDRKCVERVAEYLTKSVIGDITDEDTLKEIGIQDMNGVVIGVADEFEQAILATLLVKELGVKKIIVKATNSQNKKILEKVGADRVIRVEKEMGEKIAKSLVRSNIFDITAIDDDNSIVEIKAPKAWSGKTIYELDIRNRHNLNVLGYKSKGEKKFNINAGPDYRITDGDILLVLSETENLNDFSEIHGD